MFAYTVHCTFENPAVVPSWIAWLEDEHLADMLDAGAACGEIVRLDGSPASCEARYLYDSREDFEAYERDHAPRLRAEGLRRFPPEAGLAYTRTIGEVVDSRMRE